MEKKLNHQAKVVRIQSIRTHTNADTRRMHGKARRRASATDQYPYHGPITRL